MLDKSESTLLLTLDKLIGNGYKILEKSEIISASPECVNEQTLDDAVNSLAQSGYIILKYKDATEYCIALSVQARVKAKEIRVMELTDISSKAVITADEAGNTVVKMREDEDEEPVAVNKKRKISQRFSTFLTGLAGGMVGGGIITLIIWAFTTLV